MTWKEDLVAAYRDHGLTVHEGAGWKEFGVGDWTYGKPVASLKHQFVIAYGVPDQAGVDMLTHGYDTGSYFLNPPVANCYLGQDPRGDVYMIAGRVAQHAGQGVRAVLDRAMADLPPVGDGQNTTDPDDFGGGSFAYLGTEMHHPGNLTVFRQYDALVKMGHAECQVFGWSQYRILEHSNTTTRKRQDLVCLDGNQLRRDIAALNDHNTEWWDDVNAAEAEAMVRRVIGDELNKRGVRADLTSEVNGTTKATHGQFQVWNDGKLWLLRKDLVTLLSMFNLPLAVYPPKPPPPPTTVNYTVKAGDNWDAIAKAHGTDRAGLQKLNPKVTDINSITPGQVLVVPK